MYVPVSKRQSAPNKTAPVQATPTTGYVPVAERKPKEVIKPDLSGITIPQGMGQSVSKAGVQISKPDTVNPGDLPVEVLRGTARSYLGAGQAISSSIEKGRIDLQTPYVQQPENTVEGKVSRFILGTDKPISLAQEDTDLLGEKYGGYTGGILSAGLAAADLIPGGGTMSRKAMELLVRASKAEDVARVTNKLIPAEFHGTQLKVALDETIARTRDPKEINQLVENARKLFREGKFSKEAPAVKAAPRSASLNGSVSLAEIRRAINTFENQPAPLKPGSLERATKELQEGTSPPIRVRRLEDGKLFIEDGRHRIEAATRLGLKNISVEDTTDFYKAVAKPKKQAVSAYTTKAGKSVRNYTRGDKATRGGQELFGVAAGMQEGEDGKMEFNPLAGAAGVLGINAIRKLHLPEAVQEKLAMLDIRKEALLNNPARMLARFANKSGVLPEGTGRGATKFGKSGDDIATELGFKDSEEARDAYESYLRQKEEYMQAEAAIKEEIDAIKKSEAGKPKVRQMSTSKEVPSLEKAGKEFMDESAARSASKSEIPPSVYEQNRSNNGRNTGYIASARQGLSDAIEATTKGTDKVLGIISTRLKNIDPSLKKAMRDFEYKLGTAITKDLDSVSPFLKAIKFRNFSRNDYLDLDLALKNGDAAKIQELVNKYGLQKEYAAVRSTLEDIYKRAEDVGMDIGYQKNYFPRMIKDSRGLLDYLQGTDDWSIITEAIKAREMELERALTMEEKAIVANTLIRGYPQNRIALSETGNMKTRQIDMVGADLNQFYDDSVASLAKYLQDTNSAIEARRFFGKRAISDGEAVDIKNSIGAYTLDLILEGKIKPSQEKELASMLRARFAPKNMSGATQIYKNLAYIDTMGSFISAITQIGDLAFSLYKGGPINTAKAFINAARGKSAITVKDLGLEKIAQEFSDQSRSGEAVNKVFKLVGLNTMDRLGKETLINSTISRFRALANKPTKDFIDKLNAVFSPEETAQVIADLKSGKVTENVKLLAFNEILDVQPVALSEMPEVYLNSGNGRVFYMLKSYMLKLYDVYRNDVFAQIRKDPKKGFTNLMYLTAALMATGATADEIKDLVLNRETSWSDRLTDNVLKIAGFSKYTIYKAREEGIGSAVGKTILPPFKLIDAAYKDITTAEEVSQLQSIDSIPVAGKLYYWWFGKGATKTEKKREKERNKSRSQRSSGSTSGLPELPSLKGPALPKLPSLPKP